MLRRLVSGLTGTASALALLAGCGPRDSQSSGKDGAPASRTLRVALLTPGAISDQSWNGGAYAGLMRIRDSLGAQVSHIQTKTPAEFDENFRQYGAQGYDLVFGHGFEYQDAASRVAPQFPKTTFVTTSGTTVGANLAGLSFGFEESSYLAGMLAARVSKTGTVGCIGGTELPPVKRSFAAFAAGVKRVRPDAKVVVSYLGSWEDAAAGKEQALAQMGQGVDVIYSNADAAGLGVFSAVRERRTARIIGSNANQNALAPDVVLGSVVIDLPHALLLVAKELQAGTFTPRVISLGLAEQVVQLVLNEQLVPSLPPGTTASIDSVRADLLSGKLTLPRDAR